MTVGRFTADAAALLAKCRYTLQYTYPYAYYLDSGPRKELVSCRRANTHRPDPVPARDRNNRGE